MFSHSVGVPESRLDQTRFHLALVSQYLNGGAIRRTPHNSAPQDQRQHAALKLCRPVQAQLQLLSYRKEPVSFNQNPITADVTCHALAVQLPNDVLHGMDRGKRATRRRSNVATVRFRAGVGDMLPPLLC